ncbi:hypothetical protein HDF16_001818 [Granulicella aggregans]|uniref:Uncharacterized protein n=1 Tax=Granulicella aggregans TaxID=474949 RepID=A0A7W7ZCC4_9BACT|nr:hypothetical protein [Granulicella aggregans]MBB5057133.1 hypothetical protein [Granulicella aggregans]
MRFKLAAAIFLALSPLFAVGQSSNDDQLSSGFLLNGHMRSMHSSRADGGSIGGRSNGSLLGIDTIPNWSGSFYYPGADSNNFAQYAWQYTMVGTSPFSSDRDSKHDDDRDGSGDRKTLIGAPIVPVNLDLRNYDGSPRYVNGQRLYVDATQYAVPVLKSPVFSNTYYDSSERPTQFPDAVQRAEFFKKAGDDWHTLLVPRIVTPRTMVLIRGTYRYALNSDGSCCAYVLIDEGAFGNALFPATASDTSTPVGAAENSGEFKTTEIASFLFPNAFLYANGDPNQCCVIGFHFYDVEPGGPSNGNREKRFVLNYSSWVSPGLFGSSFQDITALSHEMSETFNDPFVNNATPWWLSPNGNCQNNEEDGDVIEGLPNAEIAITTNGTTYHPQNEALLQWFAGVTPSTAIHHAYSYPDTTVLTSASVSQLAGCTGPLP